MITKISYVTLTSLVTLIVASDAAIAGSSGGSAPAPLLGAGIPVAIAFSAGYRWIKNRSK